MLQYDKIFFLHIPKTAGSAFNHIFKPLFGPDRYFEHMESQPELFLSVQQDCRPFFLSGHVYFEAACPLIERSDVFTVTILREPVAQLISHLKWVKYVGSPKYPDPNAIDAEILEFARELFQVPLNDTERIAGFLDRPLGLMLFDNLQVRYLSDPFVPRIGPVQRTKAENNIKKFDLLFTLDDMEKALENLANKFPGIGDINLYNSAKIEDEVDLGNVEIFEFYHRRTAFDRDLYSAAREFSLKFHLSAAKPKMRWFSKFALGNWP
ncbi:sulfotransferase family protein [Mesorhizobium sp. B283B1A]|uniref:sulfotransferase family protein n=1 Tax=Mesorhizobium TaxID=68287 RepID=UPI001CD17245|nr:MULTISPECIES: sulfotransferase family protein [Mesorhizobium]MCA0048028.1 sulfotransferase family protein [Mesorhizobium sp. B283B1A]UQS63837.1 sulfotransferase family protein [Mesorhizobium opportunistum]